MTSDLAIKAGRKLFEKNLRQYAPEDPYYETYTDKRGREKRRKRELPPGLSTRDNKVLQSVKKRAHYLDKGFHICGMRFGWSFIIGIIPGAGDIADATLNHFLIIRKAKQAEIPNWLLRRMLLNNAVAALVGLVPIAGDLVVVMFKTNSRNAALLEEFLRIRGEEFLKAESQRVQDPKVIKPGAGKEQGEKVTGKREGVSGWFGRRKSKEPVPAPGPSTAEGAPAYKGRFVENMPADDPPPRKK